MTALPAQDIEWHTPLAFGRSERQGIFALKSDLAIADARLKGLKAEAAVGLQSRLTQVAALGARLGLGTDAAPLSAGSFHVVHRLRGNDGRSHVVRSTLDGLFAEDRSLLLDRWARGWLASVGRADLVPETKTVAFRSEGYPFDFSVLAFAQGSVLRDLGDPVLDSDPPYLFAIGETLRAVHRVEGHGAGLLDCEEQPCDRPRGVHDDWPAYIGVHLEDHVRVCADAGYLEAGMVDRIFNLFEMMRPALADRPMRLLHGDLGIHNICVLPAERTVTALLDWEDALVGDPLFDVAMVSSFQPPRRLAPFMAGYGLSHPTDDEQRHISLYFLRIALSKSVHRLRFAVADQPGRTPGHHRIYRGLDELRRLT